MAPKKPIAKANARKPVAASKTKPGAGVPTKTRQQKKAIVKKPKPGGKNAAPGGKRKGARARGKGKGGKKGKKGKKKRKKRKKRRCPIRRRKKR
jgi:hypothetical protein